MSLLFFDGFDGYDAFADALTYGGWGSSGGSVNGITTSVRTGTGVALTMGSSGAAGTIQTLAYNLLTDKYNTSLFVGVAIKLASNLPSGILMNFRTSTLVDQCVLYLTAINSTTYQLSAKRGATVLATASVNISSGAWYYLEVNVKIHDTAGVFNCRINGADIFTFSGNTRNTATLEMRTIWIAVSGVNAGTTGYTIDDFYACDSAGSVNNTYLGEVRSEIITPTSDSSVAWTRNTGTSNWDAVNDTIGAPDDDTTYVASSTSTQRDEYGLSDLTGISTVAGVKLVTRARKDDANPLSLKHGIKSGATNQQVTYSLGIGYANYIDIFETSDGAGTAFTPTTVNSLLSTIEIP